MAGRIFYPPPKRSEFFILNTLDKTQKNIYIIHTSSRCRQLFRNNHIFLKTKKPASPYMHNHLSSRFSYPTNGSEWCHRRE